MFAAPQKGGLADLLTGLTDLWPEDLSDGGFAPMSLPKAPKTIKRPDARAC